MLLVKVNHLREFAVGMFGTASSGETQRVYLLRVTKEGLIPRSGKGLDSRKSTKTGQSPSHFIPVSRIWYKRAKR